MLESQLPTFKADIEANTATVTVNVDGVPTAVQIKDVVNNPDNNQAIADWYNGFPTPDYWVWKTSLLESDIYDTTSDTSSTWSWTTYKNQSVGEQNAWSKMFMGGNTNFSRLNNRVGVGAIFTGSAQANAQRDHVLAIGRRRASRVEKLFGTPVTAPPAHTGNDGISGNRGKTTNPDIPTFEGMVNGNDVLQARNS